MTPGAKKSELIGWMDARTETAGAAAAGKVLRIKLKAPPVEGKANRELVRFLAKQLGLSKSAVTLRSGGKSRLKRLTVEGLSADELAKRLERLMS